MIEENAAVIFSACREPICFRRYIERGHTQHQACF